MAHQSKSNGKPAQSIRDLIPGFIALFVIAAIGAGTITWLVSQIGPGITSFFASLTLLDSATVVALITGMVTIVTYVTGGIVSAVMKRDEYIRKHREKPYTSLISMYYDFQIRNMEKKPFTQEELLKVMNDFTKELALWGSTKTIQIWGKWRASLAQNRLNPTDVLFGMENVIMQMRKDMGVGKRGLRKGDLLRLTINDIDEHLS